jgi:4-hydroxy-4-methyl-2-oxoglutarate aldolase
MPIRSGTADRTTISRFMALSTPNVSDALDRLQIDGAPQGIHALYRCWKIVGPAATLRLVPASATKESAVRGTLEAIKLGNPGAVLVIDSSENPCVNCYGGIGGYTAKHLGLVGCVADGVMRDIDEYKSYGLPVYGKGIVQQSIRGRSSCAGYGIEVSISKVRVSPGDMVMTDESGVVIVPHDRIAQVLEYAELVKATEVESYCQHSSRDGSCRSAREGLGDCEAAGEV